MEHPPPHPTPSPPPAGHAAHLTPATSHHHADTPAAASEHSGHSGGMAPMEGMEHAGHTDHSGHETMFRNRFWVCLLLSIPVLLYSPMLQMWFGFTMPTFLGSRWIEPIFALIVFFYGGVPFLQMAVPEVRSRQPGMMTLISLAITVALGYSIFAFFVNPMGGFFWELVTLIDIMLLGHWLEMRSVRQASGSLQELAHLLPDQAERINSDGTTEIIRATQLQVGDLLLVRPGAGIPADGRVVAGESDVNEALLTGESRPVRKQAEARVIAGAINGDGSLRLEVTAIGNQTALAGIMRLVAEAQRSRSQSQLLADRAAGWLFYVALAVALITLVAWTIATGFNLGVVERVATVLVIACPHALGLAIPLVVAISTTKAAQNGILVRNRLAFENARTLTTIIFDKTGTLTKGEQGLTEMVTVDGWEADSALALTAAVEGDSEHIVAKAIRDAAQERHLPLPSVERFEALKGRGVKATVAGHTVHVGGPSLLAGLQLMLPPPLQNFSTQRGAAGQTVVYLVKDEVAVAAFALADVLRAESREAVRRLQELGLEVVMLTGDSEDVAKAVAQTLGIDGYFAQLLPEQKDQKVTELQAEGRRVAMVGDGVNDAPALTRADVGIAIGGGTDVAVEAADIILVESNPLDIVKIIALSRASYNKMIQNLWWATGYNVVALPLAAGVLAPLGILLSPAVGAVLMSLSTIIVAINAQSLRRIVLQ